MFLWSQWQNCFLLSRTLRNVSLKSVTNRKVSLKSASKQSSLSRDPPKSFSKISGKIAFGELSIALISCLHGIGMRFLSRCFQSIFFNVVLPYPMFHSIQVRWLLLCFVVLCCFASVECTYTSIENQHRTFTHGILQCMKLSRLCKGNNCKRDHKTKMFRCIETQDQHPSICPNA